MTEILSQSQIDSLLSSLTRGTQEIEEVENTGGKKVKDYDFRSPKLFTREQLKLLFGIYENYSRILSSFITGTLQTHTQVEILEVEEQHYYEFNNALPDSVLIGAIDFSIKDEENENSEDLIFMNFSKDIGFCIIDKLLGGTGKPLPSDREYTEIELSILEYFMRNVVNLMKNVWVDYLEISPRLIKIETNSRILQGISTDENVVIIVMNISVNETQGIINICIPAVILDVLFEKKNSESRKQIRRGDRVTEMKRRTDILSEIYRTELVMKGILGRVTVLSKELVDLEVGDVIKLNKSKDSFVELVIEDTTWFRGEMGSNNKKRAIAIRESLKVESDPDR